MACPRGSADEAVANLVLGCQVLLLDQLDTAARAPIVAAITELEARYMAGAVEQHADPDASQGHTAQPGWLRAPSSGDTHHLLSYLGFRLDCAADAADFGHFEPSTSAVRNLSRVLIARDTGHAVNLVGPPGIGKSAVAEAAATLLGKPLVSPSPPFTSRFSHLALHLAPSPPHITS